MGESNFWTGIGLGLGSGQVQVQVAGWDVGIRRRWIGFVWFNETRPDQTRSEYCNRQRMSFPPCRTLAGLVQCTPRRGWLGPRHGDSGSLLERCGRACRGGFLAVQPTIVHLIDDDMRWCSGSDIFRPVVVRREVGSGPLLAVGVFARAREEAVLGVLEDGDPRGGFGVLEPLGLRQRCPLIRRGKRFV